MPVIAIVGENDIRRKLGLDFLKSLFDCFTLVREKACTNFFSSMVSSVPLRGTRERCVLPLYFWVARR